MNINIIERSNLGITDYEFLSLFKDQNEAVFFRLIKETDKGIVNSYNCKLTINDEDEYPLIQRLFKKYQREGFGVYFVVNSGGTKKDNIRRINAHFLDMDFGKVPMLKDNKILKDENNKVIYEHRTKEEIENYKQNFLVNLNKFKLSPNIVVETKNGFHVYWLLNRNSYQNTLLFTPIQEAFLEYFGNIEPRIEHADPSVKSPERVLRIVDYMHLKNPADPFLIKCIYINSDFNYSQKDIISALNIDASKLNTNKINKKNKALDKVEKKSTYELTTIPIIKYNCSNLSSVDYKDIFKFLRREIDLRDFLGINAQINYKFCCIFHDDKSPSANISITSDGSYKYFCNSPNCTHYNPNGLDIIDIVEIQNKSNTEQALDYLCNYYNIQVVDTEWIKKETIKYDSNISIFNNIENFKSMFPNINKVLRYGCSVAMELLSIAKNNIHNRLLQYDGNSVFFTSNRYIAKKLKKNLTRTNQYINLLCVLGLLIKIPDNNVPKGMLKTAKQIAKKKGYNRISFYAIPNFLDVLDAAEINAKLMSECRFSINSMSKVYVENLLGTDSASKTYLVPSKDSEHRKKIREDLEYIAISNITTIGYVTKDLILKEKIFTNNKLLNYETKKYELNRIIPDLIHKYDLVYVKPNKLLKTKLGISTNKYIIVQRKILN